MSAKTLRLSDSAALNAAGSEISRNATFNHVEVCGLRMSRLRLTVLGFLLLGNVLLLLVSLHGLG
jgi:hypothetical protein